MLFKSFLGRVGLICSLSVAFLTFGASTVAAEAPADRCVAGQAPHFVFGFANLSAALGDQMGSPITCEFGDPNGTGDVHQQTNKGLAFWRKRSNTPTFTNGYDHWALTSAGLVHWIGSSIDPPSTAAAPAATSRPTAAPSAPAAPSTGAAPTDATLRGLLVSAANDVNGFWSHTLAGYKPVTLMWYRGTVSTGCGPTDGDGPFYCSADHTVYLESPFFETLWQKGWHAGLQAVVAHEIGHYVQDLSGVHSSTHPTRPGQLFSVQVELGADCLGGVWAGDANRNGRLTRDALAEEQQISYASGDSAGLPWYSPDAHGSPTQRSNAFMEGVRDGSAAECLSL